MWLNNCEMQSPQGEKTVVRLYVTFFIMDQKGIKSMIEPSYVKLDIVCICHIVYSLWYFISSFTDVTIAAMIQPK